MDHTKMDIAASKYVNVKCMETLWLETLLCLSVILLKTTHTLPLLLLVNHHCNKRQHLL